MTKQAAMKGLEEDSKPHFVLVPLMAQGHTIPMIDMALLLGSRGCAVSFITTPLNASRIEAAIERMEKSGLPIRFISLQFPCAEAGLPEGSENVDAVPSRDLLKNFVEACKMLREPLVSHLRKQPLPPTCVIADSFHAWTGDVAREFGIPRLTFNGFGCFSLLCRHIIHQRKLLEGLSDDSAPLLFPGFPHRLEITKAQAPGNFLAPGMEKFREEVMEEESRADGVVVNTFDDLEALYVECSQKSLGKKIWTVGPLSLCNKNVADMAVRGNRAAIDEHRCLSWLESQDPGSVIYVSFGSLAPTAPLQLIEVGLGLEASARSFVWVIKGAGRDKSDEVEEWLSQGFEERVKARGLVIRGWAPQVMILSHPAVGGFVTHCGWNSTLESVSAGVPMLTWPHFAEQFLNEKLIVEVLRIGVAIGVKKPTKWGEDNREVLVKKDDVKKAVSALMDEQDVEVLAMRKRAKELGEKARKAMEEGGSSYENMTNLIEQIKANKNEEKE